MDDLNKMPAFPRNYAGDGHNGMTLHQYYAGEAMKGLLANSGGPIQANGNTGWGFCNCSAEDVAGLAQDMADAMLAFANKSI